MKKTFFLILSLLFIISCTNKTYKIQGEIENTEFEGVTMNLKTFDGDNWNDAGETVVKNKKFTLEGNTERPVMAYISFNEPAKELRGNKAFVLENARIKFHIDNDMNIIIAGTKQNDLLQAFENELEGIMSKELNDSIQNNLLEQTEIENRFEALTQKHKQLVSGFSKDQINTLAGTLIFMNTYYSMDLDDKINIIESMNEETKGIGQIQSIIEQTEVEKKTAIGRMYTDFELPDTNGNPVSLSSMVGKSEYLLIDFWASWCGPCIRSFPELKNFYNQYKGNQFEILGVSLDNDTEKWNNAIKNYDLNWKHVSDLQGWQSAAGKIYAVNSIPCTLLLDRDGKILGRNLNLNEIKKIITK